MFNHKKIKLLIIVISNLVFINPAISSADLIIFSFNRPLQLYALLEGINKYISNINQIFVLYRTNGIEYDRAYNEIKSDFATIHFLKQGSQPRKDFKPLLLDCLNRTPIEYILFAVDDIIIKDYIDIAYCTNLMQKTAAYNFDLKLGTNITEQSFQNIPCSPPKNLQIEHDVFMYHIQDAPHCDWAYPNSVDMVIYKKSDIAHFFKNSSYSSPNTLEANWAATANLNNYGLFFKYSKIFNLSLNIVQQDWQTPHGKTYSAEKLLELWHQGFAIDTEQFFKINNSCCHVIYDITFKPRKKLK